MSKGIILYQSKYGATKKYAEWLKQEKNYAIAETKKAEISYLQSFDTIVLGGGVYASGIAGLQFLKKNISSLSGRKIAVFAVGASPYDERAIQQIKDRKYALRFEGKFGERPEYTGRILAVGIAYHKDDEKKRHECKVEVLREKI